MIVIESISQVVDQIVSLRLKMHSEIGSLRSEIHQVREDMSIRFFPGG
jgi:hypothetical protein